MAWDRKRKMAGSLEKKKSETGKEANVGEKPGHWGYLARQRPR